MADDTAQRGESGARVTENPDPPLPDAVFSVVNPVMKHLLASPLHGLLDDSLLTIEFTGRKSGATYRTPVGYTQFDDTLVVFTHSPWWHNFEDPQRVTVRLRGTRRAGTATAYDDPEAVAERVRRVIDAEGVEVASRVGLDIEGGIPDEETLAAAIDQTVAIEIALDD